MSFKFHPGDDAYHELWQKNCKISRCLHVVDGGGTYNVYEVVFPGGDGEFRSISEASERWLGPKRDYTPD